MKRKVRPNVVSGGTAINLGNNLYYMRGKTHKQGGIDIGSNPKTGIEVENGEVVQTSPKGLRVFSAQPILNGISPANALLMGGNPNNIFNAQEAWKQANHYNDDGTKFKGGGEEKKSLKDRVRNKLIDAYYNTTFKPAIKKYGIDEVRLRLYDNVEPYGYENAQSRIDYAINKKPLSDSERKDYLFSTKSGVTKYRDDIWRTYLNIDKKYSHYDDNYGHKVIESKYKPTNSRENKKYYTITHDDLYAGGNKGRLVNEALFGNPVSIGALKHGENRLSNTLWLYFGNHTISRGMDPEKGDYVSFYDLWDIAPSEKNKRTGRKDESRGIGTPIEFYDRLYLNDYFGVKPKVPKDSYYEGYLTPALISEEKKYGGYTPSKEILDYIKKTEGFRDKWYKDGNGIDTIGYGFTGNRIKKLYPNGITREQADKEFADSIAKRALILAKDTPNWDKLSQSQRDALLSYHYNVGEGSYRNNHPKLQQALTDSDWEAVMLNMDAGYNDKKNPGLRTRRDYERELFRSGMTTSLTGDEEKAFRDWYDRYSRSQNLDPNPDAKEHYYDYRTYWKNRTEQQKNDEWKLGNHLPDTYKKPGHPTFSTESIYSTRKTPGGTWKKVGLGPVYTEEFIDSPYTKKMKIYKNVSYSMGGDTDKTESKVSLSDFIENKINNIISSALNKSRTRTKPAVPTVIVNTTVSDAINGLREAYKSKIDSANNALIENYLPMFIRNPNETFAYYMSQANDIKKKIDSLSTRKPDEIYDSFSTTGASCIYTATDNYGNKYRVPGNQTFCANPSKYGFKQISVNDARPGDIIQDVDRGVPIHGMILDDISDKRSPFFNYSNGGTDEKAIKKHSKYFSVYLPYDDSHANAFRFVGTHADSLLWKQQYNDLYGDEKKYGGDNLKQNGYIEPSVVTAPLPKKFKGSQTAARRYAEGYQFGKQIAKERDKTAPYILAAANAPMLIEGLAVAPLATMTSIAGGYVGEEIGNKIDGPLGGVIGGFIGGGVGGGLGGRLSGGLRGGLGSGVRTGIKAGIKPIGKSIVNFGKFLKSRYIYNKSVRTGNKIYENAFNILKNRGVDEFKASTSAYDLQKIYEDNFLYKEPGKPGDITGLYYFLDNDDEAVVFNIKNLLKKNNKPTQYSSADVAKWISRDASSLKPGNRIELVADFDLSKDSAPLYLRSLQRGHINSEGKMYPIIDDNTQRMIRLNTFGKNKKSIRRIDTALNSIREIPGFKNTPSRIGVGGIQYIPAFGFEHFKYGGIHIKPSKRGTFTAAAKRHNMSVQEFARKVLNNRARFSAAMVKKANFARNASKWHKKELGGDMTKQYYITKDNIYSLGGNVRRKAFLGAEEYERFIDADGKMKYRIGDSVYSKDGFSRVTGMNSDEIDSYFDAIDNEGRGEVSPSILRNYRTIGYNRALQRTVPFIDSLNGITYLGEQKPEIEPSIITGEIKSTVAKSTINTSTNTNSKQSKAKSFKSETNVEPSIIKAYRTPKQGVRQNTIGFDSSLEGVQYYGPNRDNELPEQQTYNSPAQRTRLSINTSGRPTARAIGFAQLRHYDGRPIETPTSGTQSSPTGGQRRNSNRPTASSVPTAPAIPIDYDVSQSLNNDILTPITGRQLSPIASTNPQGLAGGTSVRTIPKNPYYSKLNVELHKIGNYIRNNPDLLGLGINLTGNLAASLINRSAIKGMRYVDTPIPISAQKLPTEVNIEPQVSSIRENVAGQERLIADNTADSRVALARRQRVRNQGAQQYQTLFGNKLNTELQLLTADRLNRQGVDAQNVTQYNQWRRGLYDFENRRREMLAENAVAGINNAAEAIAGERGYLARREARRQNLLNMGLIAATSPNAQNVIGSKEFEEFLRKIGYDGNFSLLRKRING